MGLLSHGAFLHALGLSCQTRLFFLFRNSVVLSVFHSKPVAPSCLSIWRAQSNYGSRQLNLDMALN